MARSLLECELTDSRQSRAEFSVANEADDADIRRLLRDNPMPGRISFSLEREPDYFADAHLPGENKQTIIARETGRVVCVGNCSVRERFVNGRSRRVGYLGGLRLDARHAGRFDILRRGYNLFRELQTCAPADFYFTSIAADNHRARKILERGIPGMPRYEFVSEFVTVLLSTIRGNPTGLEPVPDPDVLNQVREFVNDHNRKYQFAPKWSSREMMMLHELGLHASDFQVIRDRGQAVACAGIWDQRSFKQTVIRAYDNALGLVRPAYNLIARILDRPTLPPAGATLANGFVSHLAAAAANPEIPARLVATLRRIGGQRGLQLITIGFSANDKRLAKITSSFPHRKYRSRLYLVHWPGLGNPAAELDGRVFAPEVALL